MTGLSLNSAWTARMDSDTCSEILARFPGPVTLYPSRRKWLLLMAGCLLFAVGGIGEAHNGNAMDWLGVAFFGLGAIVPGLMLLHGAASIRLDSDGFEMTNLFRHARFHWQDASGFEAQFPPVLRASAIPPPSWNKFVAFDNSKMQNPTWARVSALIMKHNAQLGDTYGFSADELAKLKTQWRNLAVAARPR
jgi:hypothetical protein